METISAIVAVIPDWVEALLALVVALKGVTVLTPTPKDDKWLGKAYRVLEWAALNFGHAKELPGEARAKREEINRGLSDAELRAKLRNKGSDSAST